MDEKESTRELVVVDVKRYKKVKLALKESEERYRQLFENVPIGIYRTTLDGRIIDANPVFVKMAGYSSFSEMAAVNMIEEYFRSGHDRAEYIECLKRDGEIKGLEGIWRTGDGRDINIRVNAKLIHNENGEVFFEGTVEDITLSKLAEEAEKVRTQQMEILNCIISKGNLAESLNEMLEIIMDCVTTPLAFDTAGIFMYDHETKKVSMMARRGRPSQFSTNEKYMSIDNLPFSQVLQHGQSVFLDDAQKNHSYFFKKWGWRMACCVPLLSKGRVIGALAAASCQRKAFTPEEKNILEMIGKEAGTLVSKLQTETALRESEKYYRTLIETSPDVIVVMDLEARMLTVNQQFLKVGGYHYVDVIGASTYDFVEGFDRIFLEKRTARFVKKMKMAGSEYMFKKKDGQTVPLEVAAGLLYDAAGQPMGIIAMGRDISERKRAQLDIEEKNKILGILNKISLELALLPTATDISKYISKKLMEITGAIYVGVNFYNKDTRQLEFANAHTSSKALNELNRLLGKNITSIKYDVSEEMYKEITSEIVGYRKTLYETSFGAISETTSSIIHKLFKVDYLVGMALVVEGELIGTVIMAIPRGTPAVSLELLKSLSHIVSVSLRRRQAGRQLIASEEKFKNLFYISPDSIILSRLHDSRIVSVNKGFTKILGYKESDVVGKTTMEIKMFKDPEAHRKIIDALGTREATENIETWFVSKSGGNVLGLMSAASIEIDGEKCVMSTIRDISQRKQAEQELKESKALIDVVVESVPLMIFLKEATDLRFVVFNRAGEDLLGYDSKHLLGKSDLDLFPVEQASFFMANDREVLDGKAGMLDIPEEPIMTAKKGLRLLHTRKVCIRGADGTTKYLLGISEDITERKESEAKLLAYQEQLRALTSELFLIEEKERRHIAAELHDQIGQNLALCKLKVAALEKEMTRSQVKSELSTVRRLLECSIQDARSLIFDLSPPVLYELGLQAALEWLTERIEEQYHVPVEFENRAGDEILESDRQVILFQVVRELLVNVGKHSRASQAKVILSLEKPFLKIQVNDDGVGFDATQIYDAKGRQGSYGFFSMRERLNYLGGGLEVKSKPGQGSQIVLTVPQGVAAQKEKP
jgi:PAS domain S-box-containing protein